MKGGAGWVMKLRKGEVKALAAVICRSEYTKRLPRVHATHHSGEEGCIFRGRRAKMV